MKFFKKFDKNLYGRDLIVSDLHGCYSDFRKELERWNFDPEIDRMFSVGDLVDRGPDSRSCLELLERSWFHAVKGNHEILWLDAHKYWMNDFQDGDCPVDLKIQCTLFFKNGGELSEDRSTYFHFKKYIEELPSIIEVNHRSGQKFGIVHAELPTKLNDWDALGHMSEEEMANTLGESLYWGRKRYSSNKLIHPPIENIDRLYVGHTIVDEVMELGNIRYIDTGAFLCDGKLTMEVMK